MFGAGNGETCERNKKTDGVDLDTSPDEEAGILSFLRKAKMRGPEQKRLSGRTENSRDRLKTRTEERIRDKRREESCSTPPSKGRVAMSSSSESESVCQGGTRPTTKAMA